MPIKVCRTVHRFCQKTTASKISRFIVQRCKKVTEYNTTHCLNDANTLSYFRYKWWCNYGTPFFEGILFSTERQSLRWVQYEDMCTINFRDNAKKMSKSKFSYFCGVASLENVWKPQLLQYVGRWVQCENCVQQILKVNAKNIYGRIME